MTRIEEIEAREKNIQEWLADGKYYSHERGLAIAVLDLNFLLAQLRDARGKLEAVERVRVLIPHATPNEPVYYPDLPQCHPQCQRCKIDRILKERK